MIAVVRLEFAGSKHVVVLGDSGKWYCDDKLLKKFLNVSYSLRLDRGPQYGFRGHYQVAQAVKDLKGKVLEMSKPRLQIDRVY